MLGLHPRDHVSSREVGRVTNWFRCVVLRRLVSRYEFSQTKNLCPTPENRNFLDRTKKKRTLEKRVSDLRHDLTQRTNRHF